MNQHPQYTRILVGDDEPLVRRAVVRILERAGYQVESASNGAEALRLIKVKGPNHFDALVLDVVMPKMTGPEAYDEISEMAAGLPVLFMSGCPVTSTDRIVRPLVMKPFHPNLLLERIGQLLDVDQALEN